MNRRFKKRYWLVVIIVVLMVIFFSLPTIMRQVVPVLMKPYGFESMQLDLSRFNFKKIEINDLKANYSKDGREVSISISKLDVVYRLSDLFDGKIEKITIDRPDIWVKQWPSDPSGRPLTLSEVKSILIGLLEIKLPIDSVNIQNARVRYLAYKDVLMGDLQLSQANDGARHLKANTSLSGVKSTNIVINLRRKNQDLLAEAKLNKQTIAEFQLRLDQSNLKLNLILTLDGTMLTGLSQVDELSALKNLSTQAINAVITADFLSLGDVRGTAKIDVQGFKKDELSIDQGQLNIETFLTQQLGQAIKDKTKIAMKAFGMNVWKHQISKLSVVGQVDLLAYLDNFLQPIENGQIELSDYLNSDLLSVKSASGHFRSLYLNPKNLDVKLLEPQLNINVMRLEDSYIKQIDLDLAELEWKNRGKSNYRLTAKAGNLPLLKFDPMNFGGVQLSSSQIDLESPLIVDYNQQGFSSEKAVLKVSPMTIDMTEQKVVLPNVDILFSKNKKKSKVDLHWGKMTVENQPIQYHFDKNKLHATLQGINDNLQVSASYKTFWQEANAQVQAKAKHRQKESSYTGNAEIKTRLSKKPDNELFKRLGVFDTLAEYKTQIDQADLDLTIPVSWTDKRLSVAVKYKLSHLSGYLYSLKTEGLFASGKIEVLPKVRTFIDSVLKIDHLNIGVVLNNISTKIDLTPSKFGVLPVVLLKEPMFNIFEGTVSTPRIQMDLNKKKSDFIVNIDHLDLERMAASQNIEGVVMTGLISGKLPVRVDGDGLEVTDGLIENDTTGVLSYTSNQASFEPTSQLGYTLSALENYQYEKITAKVDYEKSGRLLLGVEAQGKSPNLDTKRNVNLNLNIEENMKKLLFSLRLINDQDNPFNQEIEDYFFKKSSSKNRKTK